MSTLNTKNNMIGIGGIMDSERIHVKANDRLFIDPNTRADACNERLKQLKQRYLQLAPHAKSRDLESDSESEQDTDADSASYSSIAALYFNHQSDSSGKTSSRSFVKKPSNPRSAKHSSSTKSSKKSYKRAPLTERTQLVKSIEGRMPSEVSARQFYSNPFALQCMRSDLLDDIYELKYQLVDEGVNIDNLQIPSVSDAPDIETLRLIKGILVRKTRKLQSNSIIEDILFMTLKGVEQLFDGKTEVFGAKPNLKGLTKALTLKFRNQRQHFSSMLEETCERYGVGPNSKLIAQMTISSIKRALINKDHTEDYSSNIKYLQTMYNGRQQ